jgi:hypothetical protein
LLGRLLSPTNRIRLAIKHPPWVSGLAQAMATQPENVIAYSSWASALPPLLSPPWISLRNGCPDCAWVSPWSSDRHLPKPVLFVSLPGRPAPSACGPAQVALPSWSAAPNRQGRSKDGLSASPSLQIFIRVQTMPCTDMPTQHRGSVAAIEADHIVLAYRLPHRNGRSANFLGFRPLSKLTKRSMYRCDEF